MNDKRGSAAAIAEIMKLGRGIKVAEMVSIADAAEKAGGALVALDPIDGDWCGTGRIRIKWPPKKAEWQSFLDRLVELRINHDIIINGIPVPDEILVNVMRGGGGAKYGF